MGAAAAVGGLRSLGMYVREGEHLYRAGCLPGIDALSLARQEGE